MDDSSSNPQVVLEEPQKSKKVLWIGLGVVFVVLIVVFSVLLLNKPNPNGNNDDEASEVVNNGDIEESNINSNIEGNEISSGGNFISWEFNPFLEEETSDYSTIFNEFNLIVKNHYDCMGSCPVDSENILDFDCGTVCKDKWEGEKDKFRERYSKGELERFYVEVVEKEIAYPCSLTSEDFGSDKYRVDKDLLLEYFSTGCYHEITFEL